MRHLNRMGVPFSPSLSDLTQVRLGAPKCDVAEHRRRRLCHKPTGALTTPKWALNSPQHVSCSGPFALRPSMSPSALRRCASVVCSYGTRQEGRLVPVSDSRRWCWHPTSVLSSLLVSSHASDNSPFCLGAPPAAKLTMQHACQARTLLLTNSVPRWLCYDFPIHNTGAVMVVRRCGLFSLCTWLAKSSDRRGSRSFVLSSLL